MKACFFTNEYPPNVYGGAGVHVEYLSRELAKLTPLLVKCFGKQDSQTSSLTVKGVDIDPALLNGIPRDLSFVFSAFYKNLQFFNPPFDCDIVHCHTWYSHFAGLLAKMAYGVPLVVTTHSLEPLRPWKREQIGLGFDVSSWIEEQAITKADAIIAVSQDTKQDVLRHFKVDEARIHVIPNGIDTEEYKPGPEKSVLKEFGVNPDKPYLLFVGRITRQKGIIHLVNAIPFMDPGLQIVLCAGAPDTPEIKKEMEDRIAEIKTTHPDVVWISEMMDLPRKIQFYANAELFCCPSVYEPFGIINLEAMACGVPVIGTQTGGIPEIVVHGETGLLVPLEKDSGGRPVDALKFSKDLAEAINRVFRDKTLRKSMGAKSRTRAIEVFSWTSIAKQTHNLYQKVLADTCAEKGKTL